MAVPGQRRPGQTGGAGGQRRNRGTFRGAGGRVPPPPRRPTASGKGRGGCSLSVAVPVVLIVAVLLWLCA